MNGQQCVDMVVGMVVVVVVVSLRVIRGDRLGARVGLHRIRPLPRNPRDPGAPEGNVDAFELSLAEESRC